MLRYTMLLSLLALTGCHPLKSRYAMDDPEYAAKYSDGAPRYDVLGKLKQAVDARHVAGLDGWYLSGGAQSNGKAEDPFTGAEIGFECYPTSWFSQRGSLTGYYGGGQGYAGIETGGRFQTPTRLAPFVGAGIFTGISRGAEDASHDRIDNNDNGFIDEYNEEQSTINGWLTTIYPEAGLHFWLNGSARLTVYNRYLVSSTGRENDDWMLGGQLTVFSR